MFYIENYYKMCVAIIMADPVDNRKKPVLNWVDNREKLALNCVDKPKKIVLNCIENPKK